jgi:tagatose-1,6-bisphosphate aldolase
MSLDDLRDDDGRFLVLAVDHRDSLRAFLAPDDPDGVPADELVAIKRALVAALSPLATGVMLEPEYSIPQVLDVLAPGVGFLAALEAQGYLADPGAAPTRFLDGWSPAAAAASGAAAAKLLLPFHPDRPLADTQVEFAANAVAACHEVGLPIALEPLFHGLDDPRDRGRVVLRTVERFAGLGADLLKLPFPVDPAVVVEPAERAQACAAVTERCRQPWALLSGGGSFDAFADQVEVAMGAGCAGYMVGRALWGEAAQSPVTERAGVIESVVLPRWHRLAAIAARFVPPRSDIPTSPM